MGPKPSELIEELIGVALAAGRAVMAQYREPSGYSLKEDSTPVTEADLASEAVILEGLKRVAPAVPVISEEAADGHLAEAGERFFLVDPLDGTKEFLSRNGEFTINIALVEHGEPIAGVVYAPALQRLFWGERGRGAAEGRLAPDDDPAHCDWHRLKVRQRPDAALTVVASRSHRDARTEEWLSGIDVGELVSAGSSLKFCLLAAGEADLYPRFGRTMEWDTAAGHAVLAAAGGRVDTEEGTPLTYGKRQRGFDNPGFIASGG